MTLPYAPWPSFLTMLKSFGSSKSWFKLAKPKLTFAVYACLKLNESPSEGEDKQTCDFLLESSPSSIITSGSYFVFRLI